MSKIRQKRVADQLQSQLMDLLRTELRDPRLSLVTVTAVDIDRELQYADVFISKLGEETDRNAVLHAFEGAKGFLRHELAHRLRLKTVPDLRFHWDVSIEHGERISQLIDSLEENE